jgi:DNA invertase Pin-like site-specific DNA recombinase
MVSAEDSMTKAYSYARWSSAHQSSGDSLRRQLKLSRDYAAKHGLDLDETFRDPGVSAYRGKNRVEGALANFIAEIDNGKIEPGSYLLIESLDRLSREEVLVALELFISIVRRGVRIVTLLDNQEYDREKLNRNVGLLFMSIGVMQRAHEESRTKGERVASANENKRQRARESAIPITALCPGWLRLVGHGRGYEHKRYEIIPEQGAVVRRIYLEAIAGLGKRRIANRLNRDGIPAFRGKDGWHHSSVGKILMNEAVLGLFQPHRKVDGKRMPDGPPIPSFFPVIIDEATFWQAQQAIKTRRHGAAGRKGDADTNLFSGIGVCGECGIGKLHLVNKGALPKGGKYLTCQRASRALCGNHAHFPYPMIEKTLLATPGMLMLLAPERRGASMDAAAARVTELEAMLARRKNDRQRFIDEFGGDNDPMLIDAIRRLGFELKEIEAELVEARKAVKTTEYADKRDYGERFFEALRKMHSAGPCCTDRSFGGEDRTVYQGPVSDPGQPPCHSKRTKIAVITSRSSGTE